MTKLLLDCKGINVNPIDNFELTPLKEAIINNFTEIANLLKSKGGVVVHKDLGQQMCQYGASGNLEQIKKHSLEELNTAD